MRYGIFGALVASTLPFSAALAGPCTDDIAAVGRTLSSSAALGPVTTGTVSGTVPKSAAPADASQPSGAGTSAANKVGGTAGTKEMSAAAGQVATSPLDVRRQQEGLPPVAAATGGKNAVETAPGAIQTGAADNAAAQAKMELETARSLDEKGDAACKQAVDRARKLVAG